MQKWRFSASRAWDYADKNAEWTFLYNSKWPSLQELSYLQPRQEYKTDPGDELAKQLVVWEEADCDLWEDKARVVPRAPYGKYLKRLERYEALS